MLYPHQQPGIIPYGGIRSSSQVRSPPPNFGYSSMSAPGIPPQYSPYPYQPYAYPAPYGNQPLPQSLSTQHLNPSKFQINSPYFPPQVQGLQGHPSSINPHLLSPQVYKPQKGAPAILASPRLSSNISPGRATNSKGMLSPQRNLGDQFGGIMSPQLGGGNQFNNTLNQNKSQTGFNNTSKNVPNPQLEQRFRNSVNRTEKILSRHSPNKDDGKFKPNVTSPKSTHNNQYPQPQASSQNAPELNQRFYDAINRSEQIISNYLRSSPSGKEKLLNQNSHSRHLPLTYEYDHPSEKFPSQVSQSSHSYSAVPPVDPRSALTNNNYQAPTGNAGGDRYRGYSFPQNQSQADHNHESAHKPPKQQNPTNSTQNQNNQNQNSFGAPAPTTSNYQRESPAQKNSEPSHNDYSNRNNNYEDQNSSQNQPLQQQQQQQQHNQPDYQENEFQEEPNEFQANNKDHSAHSDVVRKIYQQNLALDDGYMYDGEVTEDTQLRHGIGKYFNRNKFIIYQGDWLYDKYHGVGVLNNEEPQMLEQEFDYGDFDQVGAFWVRFEGQFENGTMNGTGRLFLSNGEAFQGNFIDGLANGKGQYHKANNEIISGKWENNKLVQVF